MTQEIKPPKSSLRNNIMITFFLLITIWGIVISTLFHNTLHTTLIQQGVDKTVAGDITKQFITLTTGLTIAGMFIVLFIAMVLSKTITQPIEELTRGVMDVARGKLDVKVDVTSQDELGQLAEGFNKMTTERKRMEEKIRESQEFLNAIIENSGDAIITTDVDGKVSLWSHGAENLYGYRSEDVLGKKISFLYPDELKEERKKWQTAVLSGETVRNIRTRIYNSNGDLIDINLTLSPLRGKDGNPCGTIGVSKDITDVITAERGLREKVEELETWQRLTVGRELRMSELKAEMKELKKRLGE
ncbi:sensor protein kinase WalK [archaeon BMS3Abin16]|nr:sensor protein kinase WalK [archaeon BMS3Abin16]GBE55967.1 sensor protein kinase WalK [archaeon BMS3Bbin16]HDY73973.1 PAS domain S-box protein [Euryarchaeota archaeon]